MKTRHFLAVAAVILWPAVTIAQIQTTIGDMNIAPSELRGPDAGVPTMQPVSASPYFNTANPAASAPNATAGNYFATPGSCDSGSCDSGSCGSGSCDSGSCGSGSCDSGSRAFGSRASGNCGSGCGNCDSAGQACDSTCAGNCGGACGGGLSGRGFRPYGGVAGLFAGRRDCADPCVGRSYFSMIGGLSSLRDQHSTGYQRDLWLQFGDEVTAGFAVGCNHTPHFRTEFEYMFRSHQAEGSTFNGTQLPVNTVTGDQDAHAGMFNVAYTVGQRRLAPYLGVGIGIATLASDVRYGGMGAHLNGDDTAIAYQWMLGLNYRQSSRVTLFGEFKYFEIIEPKLNRFGGPPVGAGGPTNIILDSQYMARDILVGIRISR